MSGSESASSECQQRRVSTRPLEEKNRLVYALFSDFERAKDLNVYKPIGDQTREIIQEQRREEFDKYHDQHLTDTRIRDDYIFRDPVFVGIQFFDVMVREAFHQEVDWHVWLSYYESFTRDICRNYEITEYSDPDAEWPNDYSRLLYEMISNMRDWIKMLEEELKPDIESGLNGPPFVLDVSSERSEAETSLDEQGGSDEGSGGDKKQTEMEDELYDEEKHRTPAEVGDHLRLGKISTGRVGRNIQDELDAFFFPHQKQLVAEIGDDQLGRNGFLSSGTGFSSITVPGGFSEGGVPVGMEFLCRPFDEPTLFEVAYAYEQGTQHRQPPKKFGAVKQ